MIGKKIFASDSRPKVLIVGGNFAGLKAAMGLSRKFAVTVIDPNPRFEYLPNIHELVSKIKKPAMLTLSNPAIVKKIGHRYLEDRVVCIDPEKNHVRTRGGTEIAYDYCIVAAGGGSRAWGIDGVEAYALPFKTVDQCHRIGSKLRDLSRQKNHFYVTIVGGGFEGIEALGEILRSYRKNERLRIRLIEKSSQLLRDVSADLESVVTDHCQPHAVAFYTRTAVEKVTPCYVFLSNGRKIRSDVTIWTAGARPNPLYERSGLTQAADQWPAVDETLRHHEFRNVFFVGDAAGLPYRLPKQAYHAMDMGTCAAKNVARLSRGLPPKDFTPSAKPILIAFGDLDTFMVVGKTVIAGTALGALKEGVFQLVMAQFDPSGTIFKPMKVSNRLTLSTLQRLWSGGLSPGMLTRLGNVRVLKA